MKNTSKFIRTADTTKEFCIIPNSIAQSKILSPNGKSLLIHIISKPDNWYYVKTKFWRETNLGRNAFYEAWKELEKLGYIRTEKIKDGNLIVGYNYTFSDSPIFGVPNNGDYQSSVLPKFGNTENGEYRNSVIPKVGKQLKEKLTKEDDIKEDVIKEKVIKEEFKKKYVTNDPGITDQNNSCIDNSYVELLNKGNIELSSEQAIKFLNS